MKKTKKTIVILLAGILLSTGMGGLPKLDAYGQSTMRNQRETTDFKKVLTIKPNELLNMTVKELIKYSRDNNMDIQLILNVAVGDLDADMSNEKLISKEEAKKIAIALINGEIIKVKLDNIKGHNDTPEYEIKILKDGNLYEIKMDGYTGKIKKIEVEYPEMNNNDTIHTNKVISEEQAKKIALEKINGKVIKIELEYDDDTAEYEIEILKDGIKYEIEMNAFTGNIFNCEIDD